MNWSERFKKGLAPMGVIRKDFEMLRSGEKLRTTNEIQDMLFIQSLEGRAHNGAGVFNKRTYVNTTIDDVVIALNRDPAKTKRARQALIDDIASFVEDTVNGKKRDRLVNAQKEPFIGFDPFRERKVNARDILRGLFIGGLRDAAEVRKVAEERYQVTIGCGECHLVNTRVMIEMGLDGEKLAHEAHEEELPEFYAKGLILTDGHNIPSQDVRYYYIRHRLGPGQSDDLAVVVAGILYNSDVALGIFLSDAIDTLEKYAPFYRDQDQDLAYHISRAFKDLQVTLDDVYELTYLSSIPLTEEEQVPDSSLRYLLTVDKKSGMSTIESHLAFIEGKPVPSLTISYKRIPSEQFYSFAKRRLINVRRLDSLAVPEILTKEANRPLNELVQENFIVVDQGESLANAVRKFKDAKAEIIIVMGKGGKVVGTLTATDLIYLAGRGPASV
jgi:CBS domain-containing protein